MISQMTIDLASERPVYRQIAEEIKKHIARGEVNEGEELPSVRRLGQRLGVNLNTVAKAYRLLADEDLVELRQGAAARFRFRRARQTKAWTIEKEELGAVERTISVWALRGMGREAIASALLSIVDDFFAKEAGG